IEKVEGRIAIAIDDEGPGIPEEALGQVFEPFFRLDEARSSETGGSGLGLSIAQSVVHNHGGTILLSNRPGGGLRAVVTLTG
ncbi:MAG TPA: ATP-binding protein, partial [Telmatospirillum sp.]|nr:ATP-binding protein [Telmatospirillum sp.]